MNFELAWWNITKTERALDRLVCRRPLLSVAAHCEARTKLFTVARLQPALPRRSHVKSIAKDLQKECVSFSIVGFAIWQFVNLSGKNGSVHLRHRTACSCS